MAALSPCRPSSNMVRVMMGGGAVVAIMMSSMLMRGERVGEVGV